MIWLGNILRGKVTKSILKIRNIGLVKQKNNIYLYIATYKSVFGTDNVLFTNSILSTRLRR